MLAYQSAITSTCEGVTGIKVSIYYGGVAPGAKQNLQLTCKAKVRHDHLSTIALVLVKAERAFIWYG